jgi:hypothetical protein
VEVVDQAMDVVLIVFVDLPFDVIIFREFLYEHVAAYNVFDDMLLVKVKWIRYQFILYMKDIYSY